MIVSLSCYLHFSGIYVLLIGCCYLLILLLRLPSSPLIRYRWPPYKITNGPFDQDVISSSLTLEDPDLKVR